MMMVVTSVAEDFVLEWDLADAEEQIQGYKLYEKTNVSGTTVYVLLGTVDFSKNTFSLLDVTPGKHIYVATAFNTRGESDYSNEAIPPTKASRPKNNKILKISN